ncbi:hypothetical protein L1887_53430 [Cichorium endivia]|nr:hypothetical protein L1887_53430 [Cichorium endivia]
MPRHLISDAHEWINEIPHCPCLLSSETTAKGTGLAESAGKEDPVELDSSGAMPLFLDQGLPRQADPGRKTLSGGEFGWGGTSVKR